MKTNPMTDSDVLRRYLLGSLEEEARQRVGERIFSDDSFLERIGVAEDDLIDEYLQGALSRNERELFESCLAASPRRRERLEAARALHENLFRTPQPAPAMPPWRGAVATLLSPARLAWMGLFALLLFTLGWWIASTGLSSRAEVAGLRQQLAEARDRLRRLESAAQAVPVLSFVLSPGLSRSGIGGARLVIPDGDTLVRFQLDAGPGQSFPHYRAAIQHVDGTLVWSQDLLRPSPVAAHRMIAIEVPSRFIPPSDYVLTLSAAAAAGYSDVSDFSFRVVRP